MFKLEPLKSSDNGAKLSSTEDTHLISHIPETSDNQVPTQPSHANELQKKGGDLFELLLISQQPHLRVSRAVDLTYKIIAIRLNFP